MWGGERVEEGMPEWRGITDTEGAKRLEHKPNGIETTESINQMDEIYYYKNGKRKKRQPMVTLRKHGNLNQDL